MKTSRVWKVLKVLLVILIVYSILCILWSMFYFLTFFFLYHHYNINPDPWLRQIVNAGLGVFIFGVIMSLIGRFFGPKRMTYFRAIIQAMRQIAKGNFKIEMNELEQFHRRHHHDKHNPFVQLIDSVHYMANELDQIEQLRQEFISKSRMKSSHR
ncbi:hypothetical protein QS257_10085 [Terrilactibacillus sp. S3-3]|nr:hypothetical protein QS257_10085 [Terrilactibacillus sp. S3-3]